MILFQSYLDFFVLKKIQKEAIYGILPHMCEILIL